MQRLASFEHFDRGQIFDKALPKEDLQNAVPRKQLQEAIVSAKCADLLPFFEAKHKGNSLPKAYALPCMKGKNYKGTAYQKLTRFHLMKGNKKTTACQKLTCFRLKLAKSLPASIL